MDGVDGSAPMSLGLTDEPRVHDLLTRPEALDRQALGVAERMDRFGGRAAERFVGFGAAAGTTIEATGTGSISIHGEGGHSGNTNQGVNLNGNVTTNSGDITLVGVGGPGNDQPG